MARYTDEQVEKLAEFARVWWSDCANPGGGESPEDAASRLGISTNNYLADWLRPEDWAMRAAREWYLDSTLPSHQDGMRTLAAIIRKHAEGRT